MVFILIGKDAYPPLHVLLPPCAHLMGSTAQMGAVNILNALMMANAREQIFASMGYVKPNPAMRQNASPALKEPAPISHAWSGNCAPLLSDASQAVHVPRIWTASTVRLCKGQHVSLATVHRILIAFPTNA